MSLLDKLSEDLKAAMKGGDKMRVETVRMLRGQLKDFRINQQHEPSADEEIALLVSAAKRRRESIEAYGKAGRQDLADKEAAELAIISEYLPKGLTQEEVAAIISAAIAELGAPGPGDVGKVMGKIMGQVKGRADGKLVQQLVRERLGA